MFSLIIVIIAIALVAVLAWATIYYGGSALNKSSTSAMVAETLNKGNQISAAFELYRVDHDGALPTGTQAQIISTMISSGYLSSWPANNETTSWSLTNDYTMLGGLSQEQCDLINSQMGITGATPACDDPLYAGKTYCCTAP